MPHVREYTECGFFGGAIVALYDFKIMTGVPGQTIGTLFTMRRIKSKRR
jgi:hypothetical protein